ncbi:YggN family protein [Aequorivita echinoideorum]|uniref:Adhesin domain-containing protein n=1 Tax=Aequorivita echinoideorum TaxID=1549647 RepID=A0ABS5S611_9FLAO|nr:hypothetical protein [Aequorivita echinoideorum]MBT0608656.1 hypothetical protein [Aequorivita echinoideorum]
MNNSRLFNRNAVIGLLLAYSTLGFAQKNYVESFNVSENVEVEVNTSYTNVIFETWNKDRVEVEAFIEGSKLSEEEKQRLMKNWNLDITGNSKKITINSNAGNDLYAASPMPPMPPMDFIGPLMENMVMPMLNNFQVPPLPPEVMQNVGNIQFDYEEFQKDEEGYMKKFEAQMDKKFGKNFEKKMEAWGKNFETSFDEKKADSIGEAYGKKMEAWGEAYGKKMEAWGEQYGKQMEAWAENFSKQFDGEGDNYSKKVITSPNGKTVIMNGSKTYNSTEGKSNKTIIIRLPKNSKTAINVRHGELKMADANNVRATLNYSAFTANSIDGGQTLINASYAPVAVNNWKKGTLNVKYVDDCTILTAEKINMHANSSDVKIGTVGKEALLSGSFGDLKIDRISDNFETLDIQLENTDAIIKIPAVAFSFYFNGKKSTLKYPKTLQLKETKSSDRALVKGYNLSNGSNKTLTLNATYSNVSLQ